MCLLESHADIYYYFDFELNMVRSYVLFGAQKLQNIFRISAKSVNIKVPVVFYTLCPHFAQRVHHTTLRFIRVRFRTRHQLFAAAVVLTHLVPSFCSLGASRHNSLHSGAVFRLYGCGPAKEFHLDFLLYLFNSSKNILKGQLWYVCL